MNWPGSSLHFFFFRKMARTCKSHLRGLLCFSFISSPLVFLVNDQGPFIFITAALCISFVRTASISSSFWSVVLLWWLRGGSQILQKVKKTIDVNAQNYHLYHTATSVQTDNICVDWSTVSSSGTTSPVLLKLMSLWRTTVLHICMILERSSQF